MSFQIGVIQFPGSNCERETKLALLRAHLNPVDIFWFDDVEKLKQCDGYVIVGGFSYEDRGRSGVIAAHDPFMKALTVEASTGKPILGICNGAQILVESGLVPGCVNDHNECQTVIALAHNQDKGFYNVWVSIKTDNSPTLKMPIAHAEGRFLMSDDHYALLKKSNVECWYYVGENPNGAYQNLAAVGNFSGNILAMMPHPERTVAGNVVFEKMRTYLEDRKPFRWITHRVLKTPKNQPHIKLDHFDKTYFVTLAITDNEAISIQMALNKMDLNIAVHKYRFWGLEVRAQEARNNDAKRMEARAPATAHPEWNGALLETIENSFELWNPKKEIVSNTLPTLENTYFLLVVDHHDSIAPQKKLRLQQFYNIKSLTNLTTGIVWQLTGSEEMISKALTSPLLLNPVSQYAIEINPEVLCQ